MTVELIEDGKKARPGEGVGPVPGQLPEKTRDGQTWAEWAREWRENPQGKADRLMDQWEAESEEPGGSQKRNSKKKKTKKKKGGAGPSRGVVGSGFGGAARPTKNVPKGLVVAETGAGTGDVVDWSAGEQLAETDRRQNMEADWQQDAQHLESLDPLDREKLAEKLRMALGKKPQKAKKKAPSSDGRGFGGGPAPHAGGKGTKKGGGNGRAALASAAAAAGAVVADDFPGVSVFPSAPAEGEAPAAVAGQSGGESVPRVVAPDQGEIRGGVEPPASDVAPPSPPPPPLQGESTGGEDVVLGGVEDVEDGIETAASTSVQVPAGAGTAVEEGGTTPSKAKRVSPGEQVRRQDGGVPHERVMGFGRGVAVVEACGGSGGGGSSDKSCRDEEVGAAGGPAESSAGVSADGDKLSNALNFGRGVAIPTEVVFEDGVEEGSVVAEEKVSVAADDARLRGFGRGVAFPVESDER
eukprot:g19764.t1